MLVIRLRRAGSKKRPFFRVVVTDSRAARDSSFVEVLGFYNPRTTPETLNLKRDRVEHWLGLRQVTAGEPHFGAPSGQNLRRHPTDARACTSNEINLAVQVAHCRGYGAGPSQTQPKQTAQIRFRKLECERARPR
jgi:small subunit ribosomal protein S16